MMTTVQIIWINDVQENKTEYSVFAFRPNGSLEDK